MKCATNVHRQATDTRRGGSDPVRRPEDRDPWARAGKLDAIRTPGGHRRYLKSDVLAIMTGEHQSQKPDRSHDASEPGDHARPGPRATGRTWTMPRPPLVSEAVAVALEAEAEEAAEAVLLTAAAVAAAAEKAAAAAPRHAGPSVRRCRGRAHRCRPRRAQRRSPCSCAPTPPRPRSPRRRHGPPRRSPAPPRRAARPRRRVLPGAGRRGRGRCGRHGPGHDLCCRLGGQRGRRRCRRGRQDGVGDRSRLRDRGLDGSRRAPRPDHGGRPAGGRGDPGEGRRSRHHGPSGSHSGQVPAQRGS